MKWLWNRKEEKKKLIMNLKIWVQVFLAVSRTDIFWKRLFWFSFRFSAWHLNLFSEWWDVFFFACSALMFRAQSFVTPDMKNNWFFLHSSGKRPIQTGQLFGWKICNCSEIGGWCCFPSERRWYCSWTCSELYADFRTL